MATSDSLNRTAKTGAFRTRSFALLVLTTASVCGVAWSQESIDRTVVLLEDPFGNAGSMWGAALAAGEWSGNGRDELLVSAPFEPFGGGRAVLYSTEIDHLPTQIRMMSGIASGDRCGTALGIVPQFDGAPRFLFGCPGGTISGQSESGYVRQVAMGPNFVLHQAFGGSGETIEAFDHFGEVLAVGDFDGDGRGDYAVSAPSEKLASPIHEQGIVSVVTQPQVAIVVTTVVSPVVTNSSGRFGQALAVGDFNGDDYDDLAVGEPGATWQGHLNAGLVHVFFGSAQGLSPNAPQTLDAADFGFTIAAGQEFGGGLAAGDFDRFGAGCPAGRLGDFDECKDDLAIGLPGFLNDQGALVIATGVAGGLSSSNSTTIRQDDLGPFATNSQERFGEVLFAGQLDGVGGADLAIGVPNDVKNAFVIRGLVHFLYSAGSTGLEPGETISYSSITGQPTQPNDLFGSAITAGQFDSLPKPDIAIGAPGMDVGETADVGRVVLLYDCLFCDGFESGSTSQWN